MAAAPPGAGRLTIAAGGTTVDAGTGDFNLFYRPDPATALAQRAYAQASLASIASPVQSDAGTELPLWEQVATTFIPQYIAPAGGVQPNPGFGVRPPGLYVQVTNGAIVMSNTGGTQNFSAGQFGYTPSFASPPVMVPFNPGLTFSLPPTFLSSAPASGSTGSTAATSTALCANPTSKTGCPAPVFSVKGAGALACGAADPRDKTATSWLFSASPRPRHSWLHPTGACERIDASRCALARGSSCSHRGDPWSTVPIGR